MNDTELAVFQRGFNHGQILEKYAPSIAVSLRQTYLTDSPYLLGLICGMDMIRQEKNLLNDFEDLRNNHNNHDKNRER